MVNIYFYLHNPVSSICDRPLQEKESRLEYMRKQARGREGLAEEAAAVGVVTAASGDREDRHVNLFRDIQQGVSF